MFDEGRQLQLNQLQNLGSEVLYFSGDVSDLKVVQNWVAEAKPYFGGLHGVIHCAGIIEEGLLIDKSWEKFNEVLSPKVQGTLCLDEATQAESLECFVLFSSTSARFGLGGASDYASANGFLDGFASWRAQRVVAGQRQGKTVSINWPYWSAGGMQADEVTQRRFQAELGLYPLPTELGLEAFFYHRALQRCSRYLSSMAKPNRFGMYCIMIKALFSLRK